MKDVRISGHGNWRHVHWNAFVAAYRHSPFFDYYADEFHVFFEREYEFLYDFNMDLCRWVCGQIDLQPCMAPTDNYVVSPQAADDFRERIHPKKPYQSCDPQFAAKPYYQVFDAQTGFLTNLSIIVLLFMAKPLFQ